ncbi:autophagy-related protein 18f isoform X2 [Silene latifolia]
MVPKPSSTLVREDKYSDSRPLLVVYTDGSFLKDVKGAYQNGNSSKIHDSDTGLCGPSIVRFYSLASRSDVRMLKFRSAVYSVRCSSRVIAITQSAQVHCFNAATLEREYTILTNPIVTTNPGSEGVGYGPLALGPRWLAYSGSPVGVSDAVSVSPQQLTTSATFSSHGSNGSRVALYAKESSKHLASGIASLGDKGYKKLSRYCSDLRPGATHIVQSGVNGGKSNGSINSHLSHIDSIGMVIVKDVVTKAVIAQFRAHKNHISALCFDPSGTLLVTASVQGHSINVFRILPVLPGASSESDTSKSYVHLYKLQRGLTNAIIQDISFSDDSRWVMISSSRGTNHLFAISPFGGPVNLQFADDSNGPGFTSNPAVRWSPKPTGQMSNDRTHLASGPPITLSVVSRIRNGTNGWRGTVNNAAAVATGKNSSLSGAIAATFCVCEDNDINSLKPKYNLLVFTPAGCLIQYALRVSLGLDTEVSLGPGNDSKLVVEATQKWNICQKRRERDDNCDIYGENGSLESKKIFGERTKNLNGAYLNGRRISTGCPEERNHFYISQAELQMHEQQVPLWAKSQIYFHSMMFNGAKLDVEHASAEIEIERISSCAIEARRKNLVPVFYHLDSPKSAITSVGTSDGKVESQLLHQRSSVSQNGNLHKNGNALGLPTENGAELHSGMGEGIDDVLKLANKTIGNVYTNDSPKWKPELQIVNSRDKAHLKMEANLKFVNRRNEDLRNENQLEDELNEFD